MSKNHLSAVGAASVIIAAGLATFPSAAHHSFAMFDQTQRITVSATVTRFDWLNPHTWLYISTTTEDGEEIAWALEGAGTGWMTSAGWNADTVKPGDTLVIDYHPMKDGTNIGPLLTISFPDGREMCSGQGCRNEGEPEA